MLTEHIETKWFTALAALKSTGSGPKRKGQMMFETKTAKAETPLDRAIAKVHGIEAKATELEAKLSGLRESLMRLQTESARAIMAAPESATSAAEELTRARAEIELVESALLMTRRTRFDAIKGCGLERVAEMRAEAAAMRTEAAKIEKQTDPLWERLAELEGVKPPMVDLNAMAETPRSVELRNKAEWTDHEANQAEREAHQAGLVALYGEANMNTFREEAAAVGVKL